MSSSSNDDVKMTSAHAFETFKGKHLSHYLRDFITKEHKHCNNAFIRLGEKIIAEHKSWYECWKHMSSDTDIIVKTWVDTYPDNKQSTPHFDHNYGEASGDYLGKLEQYVHRAIKKLRNGKKPQRIYIKREHRTRQYPDEFYTLFMYTLFRSVYENALKDMKNTEPFFDTLLESEEIHRGTELVHLLDMESVMVSHGFPVEETLVLAEMRRRLAERVDYGDIAGTMMCLLAYQDYDGIMDELPSPHLIDVGVKILCVKDSDDIASFISNEQVDQVEQTVEDTNMYVGDFPDHKNIKNWFVTEEGLTALLRYSYISKGLYNKTFALLSRSRRVFFNKDRTFPVEPPTESDDDREVIDLT
jgi:hypothetical protein